MISRGSTIMMINLQNLSLCCYLSIVIVMVFDLKLMILMILQVPFIRSARKHLSLSSMNKIMELLALVIKTSYNDI